MADSDGVLVSRVLDGDRDAFATLYDRRAGLIRALCHQRTRDHDVAADLTQEVFMRAYAKLDHLADPDRFGAWLIGISKQVCREWARGAGRRPASIGADVEVAAPEGTSPLEGLAEALATLSEKERFVVHAYYMNDCTLDDVCGAVGLSRLGAYHVLATARSKIHAQLRRIR